MYFLKVIDKKKKKPGLLKVAKIISVAPPV